MTESSKRETSVPNVGSEADASRSLIWVADFLHVQAVAAALDAVDDMTGDQGKPPEHVDLMYYHG